MMTSVGQTRPCSLRGCGHTAIELDRPHGFSFWDALVLRAAKHSAAHFSQKARMGRGTSTEYTS
jgi:predicted nucleic acid-binding protein